jgi:phosphonate transport system ATP-binding protein
LQHLELSRLSARHPAAAAGVLAVQGVDLKVARGEVVAIIGPSGAGKTSLLHALACALRPESGELALFGEQPWRLPRRALHRLRGRLFLAPQTPPLPPRQRVVTAVLAGRLPRQGLWSSVSTLIYPRERELARAALAQFDLGDKLFERVDRLSGGERQRVALARALVSGAELLLIDEPLSALDPARAAQAIDALVRYARDTGATLVTTLHQVEVARARFSRIVALSGGRVRFDLPAAQVSDALLRELYADHQDELGPQLEGMAAAAPLERADAGVDRPMTCR